MEKILDRNPDVMLNYAKEIDEYVSKMTLLLRKTEGVMDGYGKQLDDNCALCIQRFHEQSDIYLKQLNNYHEMATSIRTRANKLIAARERGASMLRK